MGRSSPTGIVSILILFAAILTGCATGTGVVRPSPFPGSPARGESRPVVPSALVEKALALRGIPYRFGGEDPRTGLDCSGLVRYVFLAEGINVPRTVEEQFALGAEVKTSDVQPGDLIFFDTTEPGPSHVGIAVNFEAFVHAPGTGGVVRVDDLAAPYWRNRVRGVRRIGSP